MKTLLLLSLSVLAAWLVTPSPEAAPAGPTVSAPASPEIDPWEWVLPKRKEQSCQALTTCACVPDRSSEWCIQSGLHCKDANGIECQWPPEEEPVSGGR